MCLPATTDSVDRVARTVADLSAEADLTPDRGYKLRLAVEEIATNIVTHGYGEAADPPQNPEFEMEWDWTDEWVRVCLVDSARPFDPTASPAPNDLDTPLEQRHIGGLGIHLARVSLDEFRYERRNGRNRVTLGLRRVPVPRAV